MRAEYDQNGKKMLREMLEGHSRVEAHAEVPAEPRYVDLWATPLPEGKPLPDHFGFLGRISRGAVTFEFFHNTPSGAELRMCLIKHGEFCHSLSGRKELEPIPFQWVISSGRPKEGIEGLGFRPTDKAPGIYDAPPLHYTRLVVVNELKVERDTLLVRILGKGAVLRNAIAELMALPADAPERTLALPILLRGRLSLLKDPAEKSPDAQEYLMDTEDLIENFRREVRQEALEQGLLQGLEQGRLLGREEGREQGREQGERKVLLRQLRRRFGAEIDGEIERRVASASAEQVELWTERVLSVTTLTEVLAD